MKRIVIAIYKPKTGQEEALISLVKRHTPILLQQALITERKVIFLKAKQGEILEIFEWVSSEAIELAHENVEVQKLWNQFAELCTYETLQSLDEAKSIFSDFEPLDINA